MVAPHETLHDEINSVPNMSGLLQQTTLPPSYYEHRVVKESTTEPVYPFVLYADGIAFGRNETVLAFFIYSLLTGTRHLIAALRKTEMCRLYSALLDTIANTLHLTLTSD
jgi:hypothetical protein